MLVSPLHRLSLNLFLLANTVKDDPRLAFLSPLIPQQLPLPKAIELKQKVVTSLKQDIATDEETLLDANSSSAHLQIPH